MTSLSSHFITVVQDPSCGTLAPPKKCDNNTIGLKCLNAACSSSSDCAGSLVCMSQTCKLQSDITFWDIKNPGDILAGSTSITFSSAKRVSTRNVEKIFKTEYAYIRDLAKLESKNDPHHTTTNSTTARRRGLRDKFKTLSNKLKNPSLSTKIPLELNYEKQLFSTEAGTLDLSTFSDNCMYKYYIYIYIYILYYRTKLIRNFYSGI